MSLDYLTPYEKLQALFKQEKRGRMKFSTFLGPKSQKLGSYGNVRSVSPRDTELRTLAKTYFHQMRQAIINNYEEYANVKVTKCRDRFDEVGQSVEFKLEGLGPEFTMSSNFRLDFGDHWHTYIIDVWLGTRVDPDDTALPSYMLNQTVNTAYSYAHRTYSPLMGDEIANALRQDAIEDCMVDEYLRARRRLSKVKPLPDAHQTNFPDMQSFYEAGKQRAYAAYEGFAKFQRICKNRPAVWAEIQKRLAEKANSK